MMEAVHCVPSFSDGPLLLEEWNSTWPLGQRHIRARDGNPSAL